MKAEITIPYPTVQVEVRLDSREWPEMWVELPTVPMPGDIFHHYGKAWTVLRREFTTAEPGNVEQIVVVVRERDREYLVEDRRDGLVREAPRPTPKPQ